MSNGETITLTLYEVLGVQPTASAAEIESAYQRLVTRWHPDRHQSHGEWSDPWPGRIFRAVGSAYGVLKDAKKREQYDLFLRAMKESQQETQQHAPQQAAAAAPPIHNPFPEIVDDLIERHGTKVVKQVASWIERTFARKPKSR